MLVKIDDGASVKVTLWEEHIRELQNDVIFELENLVVPGWDGRKFLSITKDSMTSLIADIEHQ